MIFCTIVLIQENILKLSVIFCVIIIQKEENIPDFCDRYSIERKNTADSIVFLY